MWSRTYQAKAGGCTAGRVGHKFLQQCSGSQNVFLGHHVGVSDTLKFTISGGLYPIESDLPFDDCCQLAELSRKGKQNVGVWKMTVAKYSALGIFYEMGWFQTMVLIRRWALIQRKANIPCERSFQLELSLIVRFGGVRFWKMPNSKIWIWTSAFLSEIKRKAFLCEHGRKTLMSHHIDGKNEVAICIRKEFKFNVRT